MNKLFPPLHHWLAAIALCCLLSASNAFAQTETDEELLPPTPSRFAQMALNSARTEPAHYVRDLLVLIDLGETEFAEPVFAELAGMELDDQQRAALVNRFGTAALLRLARAKELDGAADFVTACMDAVGREAASAERLSELVQQVTSGEPGIRLAIAKLQVAGEPAVLRCLEELGKTDDESAQNRLREAIVAMAPQSIPPVAAALDDSNSVVQQHAAWALGQVGDRVSIPRLAAIAAIADHEAPAGKAASWAINKLTGARFDPATAQVVLQDAIDNTLAGSPPRKVDGEGMITVWAWDAQAGAPQKVLLPPDQAGLVHAAQLASDLWRINQGDDQRRAQAITLVQHANWLLAHAGGAARVPAPEISDATDESLSDVLSDANEQGYAGAAIAVCRELASRGAPDVLHSYDGKPTPLAASLDNPSAAVRFAALDAIMQLAPKTPFPGSSKVADALLHFASSDGASAAVVAMPKIIEASTLSGHLAGGGVVASATNFGDQASKLAAESADIELVMLDMWLLRPRVREVLFRLRRQPTTALLPVALLAPDGRLAEAKQLAREHQRVLVYPRPHSAKDAQSIAQALLKLTPVGEPGNEARAQQALAAAGWVKTLLEEGPSFYNLRARQDELLAAVNRAPDALVAIPSLALLGTPDSQSALVNIASLDVLPIATREAAADAFSQSVDKHGLLLTTEQIKSQYQRYNASQNSDQATQDLLGVVLDSIESLRAGGS